MALPGGRCEMIECDGVRILNDTYNANPESVRASLETVRALRGGGRLVVAVGTMLELGEASERLHRETAQAILEIEPDLVGAVGSFVQAFGALGVAADRLVTADDAEELGRRLCPRLRGGDLVLLKGSRGVRLERAIPLLTPGSEASCSTTS